MEALVQRLTLALPRVYKVVSRSETDVMLKWNEPLEIQDLSVGGLKRVAAIGDGNCLLHSFLYSTSPTYRSHTNTVREILAAAFRDELISRREELSIRSEVYYAAAGGAVVVNESLEDLLIPRKELGIEIAPIIGQLYNYNLVAAKLEGTGRLRPVRLTYLQFNPELPTVVLHYVGGGVDFGQGEFRADGHYEPIIYSTARGSSVSEGRSGKRKTAKKSKESKLIALSADTLFEFPPGAPEIEPLLALFRAASE